MMTENNISTRDAYGYALADLGSDTDIVVLDADLMTCTMSMHFCEKYPERFVNCGIQEANMVGMGAGLASTGKIPFVNSFAMFMAGRCFEQIRNSVCYPNLNVKLVGTHAGISVGEDGATHQCIEDIGIMRVIPNMTVVVPCDANETREAVKAIYEYKGPVYFRLGRSAVEDVTSNTNVPFELGKARQLQDGSDLTIIATGLMVQEAIKASKMLEKEGVSVRILDMHTIKPIDKEAVIKAATETGKIVTAEEHNVLTGLGSAVSEVLSTHCPTKIKMIGMQDEFGKSGSAEELKEHFSLNAKAIYKASNELLEK